MPSAESWVLCCDWIIASGAIWPAQSPWVEYECIAFAKENTERRSLRNSCILQYNVDTVNVAGNFESALYLLILSCDQFFYSTHTHTPKSRLAQNFLRAEVDKIHENTTFQKKKKTYAATANLRLAANKPRPKDLSHAQSAPDFWEKLVDGSPAAYLVDLILPSLPFLCKVSAIQIPKNAKGCQAWPQHWAPDRVTRKTRYPARAAAVLMIAMCWDPKLRPPWNQGHSEKEQAACHGMDPVSPKKPLSIIKEDAEDCYLWLSIPTVD